MNKSEKLKSYRDIRDRILEKFKDDPSYKALENMLIDIIFQVEKGKFKKVLVIIESKNGKIFHKSTIMEKIGHGIEMVFKIDGEIWE